MLKIPVVIDCDPGTDDALAILMVAAAKNIEIKAITTVAGNLNKSMTSYNARKIADYFNIKVPIGEGSYPIMKKFEPLDISICGESGLGDAILPEPTKEIDKRTSVQILYQCALEAKGDLQILASGPLTNIALLISEYPDIRPLIKKIVLMGGAVDGGNITPKAEFNIYTDAEAAKIVFQSGIPLTMVGLEVCYQTPVFKEELGRLVEKGEKASDFIAGIMYYPGNETRPFPEEGLFIYDALAAAVLIDPTIMEANSYYVDVETKGELTYGQTVVDVHNYLNQKPNTLVAERIDKIKYLNMLKDTITFFQGGN
jgi:inosine-uridine nucleoside N-ribohydrolase